MYDYGYTGDNGSYRIAYIEISTSTGTKRGYVYNDQLDNAGYNTSVARVTATNSAYSGPEKSPAGRGSQQGKRLCRHPGPSALRRQHRAGAPGHQVSPGR